MRQGISKPGSERRALEDAVLELLAEHEERGELPTSIRFLFYELEQRGAISKKVEGRVRRSDTYLSEALMRLRDAAVIPWDWLVDDTREMHSWYSSESVAEYVEEMLERARINPWQDTAQPLIITEARTVAGVLTRGLAPRYMVSVAATNGQCAGFTVTEIAPLLSDPATSVLYVGDLDDCGTDIEHSTRRLIELHAGRNFDASTWRRIAITKSQAEGLRRAGVRPIVKQDKRYKDGRQHEAYECEVLGQGTLMRMIQQALDELLPEPLSAVLAREEKQREEIRARLGL